MWWENQLSDAVTALLLEALISIPTSQTKDKQIDRFQVAPFLFYVWNFCPERRLDRVNLNLVRLGWGEMSNVVKRTMPWKTMGRLDTHSRQGSTLPHSPHFLLSQESGSGYSATHNCLTFTSSETLPVRNQPRRTRSPWEGAGRYPGQ